MSNRILPTGAILAVLLACASPTASTVSAQEAGTAPVMKRLDDLELLQRRMQQQLDEIKQLLLAGARPGAPGPPPRPDGPVNGTLSIAGAPALGEPTATLVFVEFADFQCPYCGQFHRVAYPEIHREFVQTGKAQYVFKNFPLEGLHPFAMKSAEAAACADQQGKFWDMHDVLFHVTSRRGA